MSYPETDQSGRVAVVTGGNTGIGYETALEGNRPNEALSKYKENKNTTPRRKCTRNRVHRYNHITICV